jgi:hypothetical protein
MVAKRTSQPQIIDGGMPGLNYYIYKEVMNNLMWNKMFTNSNSSFYSDLIL